MNRFCSYCIVFVLTGVSCAISHAADWPTYRGDSRRSGYTAERLPADLSLLWTYRPRHIPQPAWSGRDTRMEFDWAYHTVIARGTLFFGSSADCKVYALDAATGRELWTFFTDGPVRFAPAIWRGRVFAVSDDGYLYCLAAKTGKLMWRRRGGPEDSWVLGNGRIISRRPARGGPVVADGVVYFAAGIWPSEGIFVYALDAATGKVLWKNDSSGGLVMEQPHGGNRARSGISAQGYMAVGKQRVFLATGRAIPAVLDRAGGELLYFHLAVNHFNGGAEIILDGDLFHNGGRAFDVGTGDEVFKGALGPVVATRKGLVRWSNGTVVASRWIETERIDRKGNTVPGKGLETIWSIPVHYGGTSLMMAGQTVVSGGKGADGDGVTVAHATAKGASWSAGVDGIPYGLSVAAGRLYVSTDQGTIYCYGSPTDEPANVIEPASEFSFSDNDIYATAANKIIEATGITEGYCLDIGCGGGGLSYALAKRTNLRIYAVDSDPEAVATARKRLDAAGLYGVRVTVHHVGPTQTPYPDYFANLIVSGRSITDGPDPDVEEEVGRVLRPYGGVACMGGPGAMRKTVRGALKGAGEWTHQYADPANTICSPERLAKGPLTMLWFADFGFEMPNRHGRGPSPLAKDGYLVIEGVNALLGVDAYNGRVVWRHETPEILKPYDQEHLLGTAGTNSNMCLGEDSVYVRSDGSCLRIDLATGRKLREYAMPPGSEDESDVWGYIAHSDGVLYGSRANPEYVVGALFGGGNMERLLTESDVLFALDVETGREMWSFRAKHSIRHNAIAIGGGRVYLIDRPTDPADCVDLKTARAQRRGELPTPVYPPLPPGELLALEAKTGEILWRTDDDVYGTMLALSTEYDVLVMGYQYSQRSFQMPSEKGDRLSGLKASDGHRLWDAPDRYISRPLINGRSVYTQPHARDLLTGQLDEAFSLADRAPGGCGTISGSTNLLLFRSGTLGYFDFLRRAGTENYGAVRPGCWINAVPACGLVLMPDATDKCSCSYLMKASVALQ